MRVSCSRGGMCSAVCPHGVFEAGESMARLARPGDCMECGACQLNCPSQAIAVDSGVGCAAAMIRAALTGKEEACCGPSDGVSAAAQSRALGYSEAELAGVPVGANMGLGCGNPAASRA